jgi:uncharacterized protein (UPF0333 family)
MRAQSAFEYLVIIGLVITFLIPVWAYVLGTQQQTTNELSLAYANNAVQKIVDTANLVYSQGPPAKVTLRVYVPNGAEGIYVFDKTLDLKVRTTSGISDVYETSIARLNLTEGLNQTLSDEGIYVIEIEAIDNVVQISQA